MTRLVPELAPEGCVVSLPGQSYNSSAKCGLPFHLSVTTSPNNRTLIMGKEEGDNSAVNESGTMILSGGCDWSLPSIRGVPQVP
jgi:hypothetical protein